jgi:PAS domain S-box-containing protein
VANAPALMMETILRVLPETRQVVVVIGNSPLEQFWLGEIRRELQPFTNRVTLSAFNELPFSEMLKRCAALPPRSAIYFPLLCVDANGVPHLAERAMVRLHEVANAPVFGIRDSQFGLGIVGGPLMEIENLSRDTAKVAVRVLRGESPAVIKIPPQEPGTPQFDGRELQRWGISEARLPAGSRVLFRQPGFWELYRGRMIAVVALCLGEGALIVLLVATLLKGRRAEEALRASEEVNRATFEQAAVGIAHVGPDGHWLRVNDRLCAIVGYEREELLQLTFQDITYPDDLVIDLKNARRVLSGEIKSYAIEKRYVRKDRSVIWANLAVSIVRTEAGEPKHFISVMEDITARKQAEIDVRRQQTELAHIARVSTMGELAASVAHELNQPLGAILANAEAAELFLQQDPPPLDELRNILAAIRKDDERAAEVIRRMRGLLRKRELDRQPIAIDSLLEDVWRLVSGDAALRGVSLTTELAPALPRVSADRVHLQQVLLNLIINGMDAMADLPRDRRQLSVKTRLGANGQVEVAVMDSGHGIAPDKLPRLFDPFYTTKPHGMGMGLSIARTIIEAHDGRIWAENSASGGAAFRFVLPAIGQGRAARAGSAVSAPRSPE